MSRGRYSSRYTDPSAGVLPVYPTGAKQALSGAGALSLTSVLTEFTSTGTDTLTLADGLEIGQIKKVTHVADGGSGAITPTNFVDGTTVTLAVVGESWTGMWTSAGWVTVDVGASIIGSSYPVTA